LVNRLEAPGGDQPGAGIGWHTFTWPLLQCRSKCLVHGFLCQFEITQQANQGGQHPTGFVAVEVVDGVLHRSIVSFMECLSWSAFRVFPDNYTAQNTGW